MNTVLLPKAILLAGPTGSGKTPLGEWLQDHGLWGRRCHHFDFGANLRAAASGDHREFTPHEVSFIQDVLEKGVLLENESFPLALRILQDFVRARRVRDDDLLIMNGLPRHVGQAEALAPHLQFLAVIDLQCTAEVVSRRLQRNSGGDRVNRSDDGIALVEKKLDIFAERTSPLLDFYSRAGVPLIPIRVEVHTRHSDIANSLSAARFGIGD